MKGYGRAKAAMLLVLERELLKVPLEIFDCADMVAQGGGIQPSPVFIPSVAVASSSFKFRPPRFGFFAFAAPSRSSHVLLECLTTALASAPKVLLLAVRPAAKPSSVV